MAPDHRDFVDVIRGLAKADASRGIHLVDSRFGVRFHSYAELFRRVMALARSFRERGVRRGDGVLIPVSTDVDAIASFLALVVLGAVPFSVSLPLMGQDPDAHRRRIARLAAAFDVRWWYLPGELDADAGGAPADRVLRAGGEAAVEASAGPWPEPAQRSAPTTSCSCSSPRAAPPSPRASGSRTAASSTTCRSSWTTTGGRKPASG